MNSWYKIGRKSIHLFNRCKIQGSANYVLERLQEGNRMGCLKFGCAFIGTLIFVAILLVIGAFLGALANDFLTTLSSGTLIPNVITSPVKFLLGNIWGAGIGAALGAGIGLMAMVSALGPALDANWLKKYGKPINATVTEIKQKARTRRSATKGKPRREQYFTYFVSAEWREPKTNRLHIFHSPELSTYPERLFPGCGIRIVIDPRDFGRYHMDL